MVLAPTSRSKSRRCRVKRKRRRCLVVDETKVRTKNGWIYVFGAVDPENREAGIRPPGRRRGPYEEVENFFVRIFWDYPCQFNVGPEPEVAVPLENVYFLSTSVLLGNQN